MIRKILFKKIEILNKKIENPNFWKNKQEAEKILKEKKSFEDLTKFI